MDNAEGKEEKVGEVYVDESLPGGCSMILGDDGQQYVTIVEQDLAYAIPLSEFREMQQRGQNNLTFSILRPAPSSLQPVVLTPVEAVVSNPESSDVQPAMPVSPSVRVASGGNQPSSTTNLILDQADELDNRTFKPIRVDNWGIFLLNRFQAYFQKKEHCDLTLRFPQKNAQINVHKLVLHACTDFFAERANLVVDGVLDMPECFTPEAVAPIIRFMYTGKLDVRVGMFSKLYKVADLLRMHVLVKLLDAQINAPIEESAKKGLTGKKRSLPDDPVKQISKIRKIEKKFTQEERKAKMQQAKLEAQIKEKTDTIPGKKLPIWKRKVPPDINALPERTVPSRAESTQMQDIAPRIAKVPDVESKEPDPDSSLILKSSPKSYSKTRASPSAAPLQINEQQQNLTFEKIRQTCSRSSLQMSPSNQQPPKDMTVDEIREFMQEQRKRLAELGEDDDDDYYDNDAEMGYDEEAEDEGEPASPVKPIDLMPPKPILKLPPTQPAMSPSATTDTPSIFSGPEPASCTNMPRKSVRFSLIAGNAATSINTDEDQRLPSSSPAPSPSPVSEEAVTPAAEAQSAASDSPHNEDESIQAVRQSDTKKVRRKKKGKKKKPVVAPEKDLKELDEPTLVANLLKNFPNLAKEKKPFKVKVMIQDANGKQVVKYIRVKATNIESPEADPINITNELGLRNVPKVCYTGKRGRPKTIKPGDFDPHESERKQIAAKLRQVTSSQLPSSSSSSMPSGDKLQQSGSKNSSEAEALSSVASSIATSLALTSNNLPEHNDTSIVFDSDSNTAEARSKKVSQLVQDWEDEESATT